jgi:hypothetical protein
MSTTMNDTRKAAMHGVQSVREGTEQTLAATFSTVVKGVNALSSIAGMLRSLDGSAGLAWLGLARRRPLQATAIFSAGIALGAGLGFLFAPVPGSELRRALLARVIPADESASAQADESASAGNGSNSAQAVHLGAGTSKSAVSHT